MADGLPPGHGPSAGAEGGEPPAAGAAGGGQRGALQRAVSRAWSGLEHDVRGLQELLPQVSISGGGGGSGAEPRDRRVELEIRIGGSGGPPPGDAALASASASAGPAPAAAGGSGGSGGREIQTEAEGGGAGPRALEPGPPDDFFAEPPEPGAALDAEHPNLTSRLDINTVIATVEQNLPYPLLLLVAFAVHHFHEIAVVVSTLLVGKYSNDVVKKQVAQQGNVRISALLMTVVVLAANILGVLLLFGKRSLWKSMLLIAPDEVNTVWEASFIAIILDNIAKFQAIALKALALLWKPKPGKDFRRQGQILTSIEYASRLYRNLQPISVWWRFFQSPGFGSVMASVTTGIYFCLKVGVLREKGRLCLAALRQSVFGHDLLHAKHVSKEELVECGDVSCPICQEELAGMQNPIKLKCEHCFCEECILEWLDRSASCPMCRTVVKPAGLRSFACGNTAQAVVVF